VPLQWTRSNRYSLRVAFTLRADSREQDVDVLGFDVIDGRYEGDVVAGLWVVSLDGQVSSSDARRSVHVETPVPQLRRLSPGTSAQIDLELTPAGGCSLRGTIRDEAGQPYGGLVVRAEAVRTLVEPSTGEKLEWSGVGGYAPSSMTDGSFLVDGLSPGRYSVAVDSESFRPENAAGVTRVSDLVPRREVELVDGAATLEYTIRRTQRVHVTGRVVIDPAWAKEHNAEGLLPMMDLVRPSGREERPDTREPVAVRAEGFELWVDAGVNDQRLELWLGSEHLVEPLTLSKSANPAPLTIRIPR
jgi:hypothetical protein